MSLRFLTSLNNPALVAGAGAAMVLGLPALETFAASSAASLVLLKSSNAVAFLINAASVSVPGRIDEAQDQAMRQGTLNPSKPTGRADETTSTSETPLVNRTSPDLYNAARTRSLVSPAGWAFAIWGPIYLGEAAFVAAQIFSSPESALVAALPQITAPFVTANLFQSLWCASFRPSYSQGWRRFVSVGMLAGTALSLSHVQAVATAIDSAAYWYFVPLSLHCGWTTAATLVNLNGSVAMEEATSDGTVIALGHASAIVAAALGIGVTMAQSAPAYGLTVAWALAACASGAKRVLASGGENRSDALKTGAGVQQKLCLAASAACIGVSLYEIFA